MPSANEMFSAYFAPAAADWQKESHLRTNALARARIQRGEDQLMASYRPADPAPVEKYQPLMTERAPLVPAPVVAAATAQATKADYTPLKGLIDSRANELITQYNTENKGRRKKLTKEQVETTARHNAQVDILERDPSLANAYLAMTAEQKAAAEAEKEKALTASYTPELMALRGSSEQNRSESQNESLMSQSGGGKVEFNSSLDANRAAKPLAQPVGDFLMSALSRQAPDTGREQARADYLRSQLPALEEELMLTGGAEEYRKRLADIESGIASTNKNFQDNQVDLTKSAVNVLKELGESERQSVKMEADKQLAQFKAGSAERIQGLKNLGARTVANIRGKGDFLRLYGQLYGQRVRAIGNLLAYQREIDKTKIYMGSSNLEQARLDMLQNLSGQINAEMFAVSPHLLRGNPVTAADVAEAMGFEIGEDGHRYLTGSGGSYTPPEVRKSRLFGDDLITGGKKDEVVIPRQRINLPADAKPARKPDKPKFANRAAMLEYAKTLSPDKRLAFIQANKDLQ